MGDVVILSKDELDVFKKELLFELRLVIAEELRTLLEEHKPSGRRRWIKTYQVKEMLDLSDTTLQTMRNNGEIPYTLLGGLAFYEYDEIVQLMEKNKQQHRKNSKQ